MITQLHSLTHSTPIGNIFSNDHYTKSFESDTVLREILEYFSTYAANVVIITQKMISIGIFTLKDMLRSLQNFENLFLSVGEFMTAPLQTFASTRSIADVLDVMQDVSYNKIVVTQEDKVIGVIDRRHLLSKCYTQLAPLIKHEYNLVHSMLGLVGEGEQGLLKLATTDSLTGIGNRRLFEKIFQSHQSLENRYDVSLFLLMFDIDDFKKINDTFGHNIGDSVLKQLTALVSKSIRKSDIFVRWGGEEFVILLRHSDPARVIDIAEQIRKRIDAYSFETIIHVTCSFGLTPIKPHESIEEATLRADLALYRAKADGKNTVRLEML
ncbi:MAG: diguanylate cyclase [Sulfuricurvum sp.]|nr:diguanylate cyclase [Sulfuricurvum sp.]